MPPIDDVAGLSPSEVTWKRVDVMLATKGERARIRSFFLESFAAFGHGAVLVQLDEGPGAPLEWLPYSGAALRELGVHPNSGLGVTMRQNLVPDEPQLFQPIAFVDRSRRVLSHFCWRVCRQTLEVL